MGKALWKLMVRGLVGVNFEGVLLELTVTRLYES